MGRRLLISSLISLVWLLATPGISLHAQSSLKGHIISTASTPTLTISLTDSSQLLLSPHAPSDRSHLPTSDGSHLTTSSGTFDGTISTGDGTISTGDGTISTGDGTISTGDGTVIDFNDYYGDYYGNVRLIAIAAGPASFAIAAIRTNEAGGQSPALFTSAKGTVWTERELNYKIGEQWYMLEEIPLGISHDPVRDEFILDCTDDTLFFIPNCSHCNRIGHRKR